MAERKILVLDCYGEQELPHLLKGIGHTPGEHYKSRLEEVIALYDLEPVEIFSLRATDLTQHYDSPQSLRNEVLGVALTGSDLSVHTRTPEIEAQIAACQLVFRSHIPFFGSCYGLQIAAAAAGGETHASDKGREFGVAKHIHLTDDGKRHPLYHGKKDDFFSYCVHSDVVTKLPHGSKVLAHNEHSVIQSAEIHFEGGVFWGVQYHPEFSASDYPPIIARIKDKLVDDGTFPSAQAAMVAGQDFDAVAVNNDPAAIARLELNQDVLDPRIHRTELCNWLSFAIASSKMPEQERVRS